MEAAGSLFGIGAALCLAIAGLCIRVGMRNPANDDGHFMTVLLNVSILGLGFALVGIGPWTSRGVLAFGVGGLLGTWIGRGASLRAIREIGASRTQAFLVSSPIFSAAAGFAILDEPLTMAQGVGAAVAMLGLWLLVQRSGRAVSLVGEPVGAPRPARPGTSGWKRWMDGDWSLSGNLRAGVASAFFGFAFVARKWGVGEYPNLFAGAFIGAFASLLMILVGTAISGDLSSLVRRNVQRVPWWFVVAGVASSLALLLQFSAFAVLPAWRVNLLVSTQVFWTLIGSWSLLGIEERVGATLVVSAGLVLGGIGLVAVGGS